MGQRKTKDVYVIEQYFGRNAGGWEAVCSEEDRAEAKQRLKEYQDNMPQYAVRLVKKREHNNQPAYDFLNASHVMWDRKDEKHIWVGTNGYKTAECREIESELMKHGFCALKQDFDGQCGKTITTYKHK